MNIGERLKNLRKAHRLSKKELAIKAGIFPSMVTRHESGENYPALDVLQRYADALDTTLSGLLAGVECR